MFPFETMAPVQNRHLCRSIAGILITTVILLVSLGSRSHWFHQWVCGEQVRCVLRHAASTCDSTHDDHCPNEKNDEDPDPLQPFCQSGIDTPLTSVGVCPRSDPSSYLPSIPTVPAPTCPCSPSSPPRAPPSLV